MSHTATSGLDRETTSALQLCDRYILTRQWDAAFDVIRPLMRRIEAGRTEIMNRCIHILPQIQVPPDQIAALLAAFRKSVRSRRPDIRFLREHVEVLRRVDDHAAVTLLEEEHARCLSVDAELASQIKDLQTQFSIEVEQYSKHLMVGAAQQWVARHPHSEAVFEIASRVFDGSVNASFHSEQLAKFVRSNLDHPNAAKRAFLQSHSVRLIGPLLDLDPVDAEALETLSRLHPNDCAALGLNVLDRFSQAMDYAPHWPAIWRYAAEWLSTFVDFVDASWCATQPSLRYWWLQGPMLCRKEAVMRDFERDAEMTICKCKWSEVVWASVGSPYWHVARLVLAQDQQLMTRSMELLVSLGLTDANPSS